MGVPQLPGTYNQKLFRWEELQPPCQLRAIHAVIYKAIVWNRAVPCPQARLLLLAGHRHRLLGHVYVVERAGEALVPRGVVGRLHQSFHNCKGGTGHGPFRLQGLLLHFTLGSCSPQPEENAPQESTD